jgi:hypothetical protein
MATKGEHFSALRTILKRNSDDTSYTDEFLYYVLKMARAFLLASSMKQFTNIGSANKQRVCVTLEDSDFYDCSCVPSSDCKVKKSACVIPSLISGRNYDGIKVMDLVGKNIPYVQQYMLSARALSKLKSPYYTIMNQSLYIFNARQKVVMIEALFEDPDIRNLCNCNSNYPDDCEAVAKGEFPIDAALVDALHRKSIGLISPGFSFRDDNVGDGIADNE